MAARSTVLTPDSVAAYAAELLRNGGNGSAAARLVWPELAIDPRAASRRSMLLRKQPAVLRAVEIQQQRAAQAVAEALDRYGATADRTADELARLAFAQMRDVVDLFTVTDPTTKKRRQVLRVRDFIEISDDAHRAIVEVTQRPDGTVNIKLGDKRAALMDLARLKGWIADRPQDPGTSVAFVIQR